MHEKIPDYIIRQRDRGQAEAKTSRPRPRPKLRGHFGLEDLTSLVFSDHDPPHHNDTTSDGEHTPFSFLDTPPVFPIVFPYSDVIPKLLLVY